MTLRIFHTGDVHLGMTFNSYGEGIREKLVQARYEALENMIIRANELEAHIFVVAGDLFNTINIGASNIERAVNALARFTGCVLVLPGNHDYDNGSTELWRRFESYMTDNIVLINEERIYDLSDHGLQALIYPAPCSSKHSSQNRLGWISQAEKPLDRGYRIGVGHGALEGLSADIEGEYYYMTMSELEETDLDLWLLGHTHVRYPLNDQVHNHRIYNAGTPEPDGLNYKGRGSAWLIELGEDRLESRALETGSYEFIDRSFELLEDEDLDSLMDDILDDRAHKKLVRLNLSGRLSQEVYEDISRVYKDMSSRLFHLIVKDDKLGLRINQEIIEREFTKGSFPYEFLQGLKDDQEALQIAYELIRRD